MKSEEISKVKTMMSTVINENNNLFNMYLSEREKDSIKRIYLKLLNYVKTKGIWNFVPQNRY